MAILTVMRHGEPIRSHEPDVMRDPGLGERGTAQISDMAELVATDPPSVVYSSPLARARQSASLVAARLGLEVQVEPDLAEFDRDSHYLHFEDGADVWTRYLAGDLSPWGTTLGEFRARIHGVMGRLAEAHPDEHVLAVCHGAVLNILMMQVLGISDKVQVVNPAYGSLTRFELTATQSRVVSFNEVVGAAAGG
jgi:probable phosphoglycerate mutase